MERHAETVEAPTFVSMAEAADLLQVSTRTIRRRVADGSLPAYRLGDHPSSRVRLRVDPPLLHRSTSSFSRSYGSRAPSFGYGY